MIDVITGAAGFIGSNLAKALVESGHHVLGLDNFRLGKRAHIESLTSSPLFRFETVDVSKFGDLTEVFHRIQVPIRAVWHLAANSDIPAGVANLETDFKDTFCTTYSLVRVLKNLPPTDLIFASSSAVYGDMGDRVLSEQTGPLLPISNYGAMKLASEGIISASAESFLKKAILLRFPNVIGTPATHGVILDFVRKLKRTALRLDVLGDGTQQKSYLHVNELVEGMLRLYEAAPEKINVINIGPEDEGASVQLIAEEVVRRVSPRARICYGVEKKGWVGDVPRFRYSMEKARSLGWTPGLNSASAVRRAVDEIAFQEDVS